MGFTGDKKREYQRQWIAKRRAKYFENKCCVICGSTEDLELDHIDPDKKKYMPAALWGMSDKNPNKIAELAKCQVLCKIHHKEKTKLWWETVKAQHGLTLYGRGCKCDVCVEAKRISNAKRYK